MAYGKIIGSILGFDGNDIPVCVLELESGSAYTDVHAPILHRRVVDQNPQNLLIRGLPMTNGIEIELHSKRFTDFHILRIIRARKHLYDEPITAYLSDVFIYGKAAVGIVYGHVDQGPHGRYADGHLLRTSDIRQVRKEVSVPMQN